MLSNNLKTLTSSSLTPELFQLSLTLHISDIRGFVFVNASTWKSKKSHASLILKTIGCNDPNIQVYQLQPNHGKFPINMVFNSPQDRQIAVNRIKHLCIRRKKPLPSLHFSLHGKSVLKKEIKAVSTILRKLKNDGMIHTYALNNFQATNHFDRLAPLYTIQLTSEPIFTAYEHSNIIQFYHEGRIASQSASNFDDLQNLIIQHVTSLSHQTIYIKKKPPPPPNLWDFIHQVAPKSTLPLIMSPNNTTPATDDLPLSLCDFPPLPLNKIQASSPESQTPPPPGDTPPPSICCPRSPSEATTTPPCSPTISPLGENLHLLTATPSPPLTEATFNRSPPSPTPTSTCPNTPISEILKNNRSILEENTPPLMPSTPSPPPSAPPSPTPEPNDVSDVIMLRNKRKVKRFYSERPRTSTFIPF